MARSPRGGSPGQSRTAAGRRGVARAAGALGLVGVTVVAAPLTAHATTDVEPQAHASADATQLTASTEQTVTTVSPDSGDESTAQDKGHRGSRAQHRDDSGDTVSDHSGSDDGGGAGTEAAPSGGSESSELQPTETQPTDSQPTEDDGPCRAELSDDQASWPAAPSDDADDDGSWQPVEEESWQEPQATTPWVAPEDVETAAAETAASETAPVAVATETTPVAVATETAPTAAASVETAPVTVVPLSAPVVLETTPAPVETTPTRRARHTALTVADAPSSSQRSTAAQHRVQGPVTAAPAVETPAPAPTESLTTVLGSGTGSSVQGSTDQLLAGLDDGIGTKLGSVVVAGPDTAVTAATSATSQEDSGGSDAWLLPLTIGLGLVGAVGAVEGVLRRRRNDAA